MQMSRKGGGWGRKLKKNETKQKKTIPMASTSIKGDGRNF